MKHFARKLAWLLAVCMAVGMYPAVAQNAGQTYTPGAYEGEAQGRNGKITVTVTVKEHEISEVLITDHSETRGISDAALETIPREIVTHQSLGLDAVTGATITSQGILDAVANALEKAGTDVEALRARRVEKSVSADVTELEADVIIVGGGATGLAAAVRLRALGPTVLLVEKAAYLGGAIAMSGGNQVVTGSKLQKEAGVTDDTPQLMMEDFRKNGNDLNVPELLALYAQNVGETTDWLHDYVGIAYDMEGGLHKLGEYGKDRELAYQAGGAGFAQTMGETAAKAGTVVLKSTRAEKLLLEEDRVAGVEAVSDGGMRYILRGKAVLLATGGYGANQEMLSEELAKSLYYGASMATGDGVIMASAQGIDAATRLMEYGKRYPNGVEVSPGKAKSTIAGNIAAWTRGAILVNREGNRVVNEKASNRTILEAEVQQTGSMLYLLMDSDTFDIWKTKLGPAGLTEELIAGYLEKNGQETPVFAHGETLEETAAAAGVDAQALKATVEKYNGYVASGKDEDFGRDAEFMKQPIGKGPYYLIEQKPRFATTMGGLVINTELMVMNKEGSAIPGLYAAGEVVGGVMGDDSPSGANNGWALTSGKLAAESIHQAIK